MCTIQVPDDFEDKSSFLVNFTNGHLVSRSPKITLYEKTKDRTKRKKILVAETEGLSYMGTNFSPDTALINTCQYCVGVLDKNTGTMTLHRTEPVTMSPIIPGAVDAQIGEEIDVLDDQAERRVKSTSQMVKVFGSEKRKRAYTAAQRNKVETGTLETALEPAFSHAEAAIEMTPSADLASMNSGLKPPHNAAAESPQEVYDINDIVSLPELKILKKTAKELADATITELEQWRTDKRYPEYVLQHMENLASNEPHRNLKCAMLLYAGYLIKMHNMNSRTVQREGLQFQDTLPPPAKVLEQLQSKFTEKLPAAKKPQLGLSVRMKDKIRLHLFALCLIIDDFSVQCSTLQQDLRITASKITDYFRALGCVVKKSGVKRAADSEDGYGPTVTSVLRIPLSFPKSKRNRSKKGINAGGT